MRAAFVASCLRGALPPVLLRAVCLVRAIVLGVVLLYVECCCVLAESGGESIGPETSRSRHLGPCSTAAKLTGLLIPARQSRHS